MLCFLSPYWQEVTRQDKDHIGAYVSWEVMCPPDTLEQYGSLIQQAYTAVGQQQPYLDRVKLMDKAIYGEMKRYCEKYWHIMKMRPDVTLARLGQAPAIDGVLDDQCWENATKTGQLKEMAGGQVQHKSFAMFGYDEQELYVAIECFESIMNTVIALNYQHDGNVFEERDSVELFIDPNPEGKRYYQIAFNVLGTVNDASNAKNKMRRQDWDSNMELAVKKGQDRWIAEFAVPFSAFGLEKAPSGQQWQINICRNRKLTDERRNDKNIGLWWEYSGWAPTFTNWHERRHFAKVTFSE